jgi:hypothetical protein
MWNLLRMRHSETCRRLRDVLEDATETAALAPSEQEHLAACPDCQVVADEVFMSRSLLQEMPSVAATPAPWFAPRVMAAIAAGESELRQSLEAWAAVPRLAARLTWASALALLVVTTWLYELPKFVQNSGKQVTAESLFDSPQSGSPDDVLPTMEAGQ